MILLDIIYLGSALIHTLFILSSSLFASLQGHSVLSVKIYTILSSYNTSPSERLESFGLGLHPSCKTDLSEDLSP